MVRVLPICLEAHPIFFDRDDILDDLGSGVGGLL
jgi:hypothetical protein